MGNDLGCHTVPYRKRSLSFFFFRGLCYETHDFSVFESHRRLVCS